MAFHFMSTNKRTKKPFWREKWERGAGEGGQATKKNLKNQREIKRVGGGTGRHADRAEKPK